MRTRNATTDLEQIRVDAGLVRLFDDARLAFVIGHEMGHGILRRVQGQRASGPGIEAQADRLGLHLSARAGFEPVDADLWEHFQRDLRSYDRRGRRSHPATWERTLALRETAAEVRARIERGEPLVPERP